MGPPLNIVSLMGDWGILIFFLLTLPFTTFSLTRSPPLPDIKQKYVTEPFSFPRSRKLTKLSWLMLDFLRISRIGRQSRKIDFSFISPKQTFGWTYSRKNSLKSPRFILPPKFKKVRNLHIMVVSARLEMLKISLFFTKTAGALK